MQENNLSFREDVQELEFGKDVSILNDAVRRMDYDYENIIKLEKIIGVVEKNQTDGNHISQESLEATLILTNVGLGGNITFTVESLKERLTNMYKSLETFVMKIIDTITEFWNKHFSSVSIYRKRLENMAIKISKTRGESELEPGFKPPASLKKIFFSPKKINAELISDFCNKQIKITDLSGEFIKTTTNNLSRIKIDERSTEEYIRETVRKPFEKFGKGEEKHFGTNKEPLVMGKFFDITLVEEDSSMKLEMKVSKSEGNPDINRSFVVSDLEKLKLINNKALELLLATEKLGKTLTQERNDFKNTIKTLGQTLNKLPDEKKILKEDKEGNEEEINTREEIEKLTKFTMGIFKSVLSLFVKLNNNIANLNIDLVKGVLVYLEKCLPTYKSVAVNKDSTDMKKEKTKEEEENDR